MRWLREQAAAVLAVIAGVFGLSILWMWQRRVALDAEKRAEVAEARIEVERWEVELENELGQADADLKEAQFLEAQVIRTKRETVNMVRRVDGMSRDEVEAEFDALGL